MRKIDWLAFITLGLVWGSSFLWIKIAVQEVGPFLLVAIRLLFGILALLVGVAILRPDWPRRPGVWLSLTLVGLTNNALPYVLISWGEKYIDSAVAAILNSSMPLMTMLLAHFLLSDDRLTPARLISLLVGFSGIVVLLSRDLEGGVLQSSLLGQGAVLLASISYAFSIVYLRKTTQDVHPAVRPLIPLLGADLLLWGLVPIVESPVTLPRLSITWIALVWLGVLGVALAYYLYFFLLHSIGPTRTTVVSYVFPLVGVILGVIFLKERLDWNLVVGGALIVGSIAWVNRRK